MVDVVAGPLVVVVTRKISLDRRGSEAVVLMVMVVAVVERDGIGSLFRWVLRYVWITRL